MEHLHQCLSGKRITTSATTKKNWVQSNRRSWSSFSLLLQDLKTELYLREAFETLNIGIEARRDRLTLSRHLPFTRQQGEYTANTKLLSQSLKKKKTKQISKPTSVPTDCERLHDPGCTENAGSAGNDPTLQSEMFSH